MLRLMCEIKKPLPVDALMAILADWETSSIFLLCQSKKRTSRSAYVNQCAVSVIDMIYPVI
jgi:hypothetical protein